MTETRVRGAADHAPSVSTAVMSLIERSIINFSARIHTYELVQTVLGYSIVISSPRNASNGRESRRKSVGSSIDRLGSLPWVERKPWDYKQIPYEIDIRPPVVSMTMFLPCNARHSRITRETRVCLGRSGLFP